MVLQDFRARPFVGGVRKSCLDYAIRFGDGAWHGTDAVRLLKAPLSLLCTPQIAERLRRPEDVRRETLLRSYRADEWAGWFTTAGLEPLAIRGPVFDSSATMVEAAVQGFGVALAPPLMFGRHLATGAIVQPFEVAIDKGCYWLTWLKSRTVNRPMTMFRDWLLARTSVGQSETVGEGSAAAPMA